MKKNIKTYLVLSTFFLLFASENILKLELPAMQTMKDEDYANIYNSELWKKFFKAQQTNQYNEAFINNLTDYLRFYFLRSGDKIMSIDSILAKLNEVLAKKEKFYREDELLISYILKLVDSSGEILKERLSLEVVDKIKNKPIEMNLSLECSGAMTNYYIVLPKLYIYHGKPEVAKQLYKDALAKMGDNTRIYLQIIAEDVEQFFPKDKKLFFEAYKVIVSDVSNGKLDWKHLFLLQKFIKYNGEKYDGEKIIDITNIISMLSQEQLDQKIPPYYKKTFRQYAEELGLFSINPIVDKKSNVKENGNNFTSNIFIVLGVLFLAILGGFLIKNRKKKRS